MTELKDILDKHKKLQDSRPYMVKCIWRVLNTDDLHYSHWPTFPPPQRGQELKTKKLLIF